MNESRKSMDKSVLILDCSIGEVYVQGDEYIVIARSLTARSARQKNNGERNLDLRLEIETGPTLMFSISGVLLR